MNIVISIFITSKAVKSMRRWKLVLRWVPQQSILGETPKRSNFEKTRHGRVDV